MISCPTTKKTFFETADISNETFTEFKRHCLDLMNDSDMQTLFNTHRGFVMRTPVLRELSMVFNALFNCITFLTLKPIKLVFGDNTPVFKAGIMKSFFAPPATDTMKVLQTLKTEISEIYIQPTRH